MTEDTSVLLTVRGTLRTETLDAARVLHNQTAGSTEGIAAARSLGDLSHNVFAPSTRSKLSSAQPGELLFLDRWDNPKGIMDFFSNAHVQDQAGRLFSTKEPTIWMPARGALSYLLPAPRGKSERIVGMLRAPVASDEKAIVHAIEIWAAADAKSRRDGRRRGQLSHEVFVKLAQPGETAELLGLDLWCDFAGMTEHYTEGHMAALREVFTGPPTATVWEQAAGDWSEW
jgi:hypothetical protein